MAPPFPLAPHTHNFRDVVALLLAAQAAVVVRDGDELTAFVTRCLDRAGIFRRVGIARARQIVAAQRGATGERWNCWRA